MKFIRSRASICLTFAAIVCACSIAWIAQSPVRVFLIGDSTMSDKPLIDNPERGWGQVLPLFFTERVQVINHAMNGRSTKSFIDEGRWARVLNLLQPGDYVFIQFGHNDAKKEDPSRYAPPRTEHRKNLQRFIHEARAKDAVPVLLTSITRREFDSIGTLMATHGEYPDVMKEVAREERVPCIDMFEKSKALLRTLGDEPSKRLYLAGVSPQEVRWWKARNDNTHFTRLGATTMAALAVEGIRELHLPLEDEVRSEREPLAGEGKVVGLDYYFNNEWRMRKDSVMERWHYTWEDTTNGGFSMLGRIMDHLGAGLDTLQQAPTPAALNRFSIYIIVDPDMPSETAHPHFVSSADADVIEEWVKRGGVILLMGNDKGNAEFEHFNLLATRFGIRFNEVSVKKVAGKNYVTGTTNTFPQHSIFTGIQQIFTKEVCTLTVTSPAVPVLVYGGDVLMASARVGEGMVFAVCDPWLYNEYMDARRLPPGYENAKAGRNLFRWLLTQSRRVHG